MSPDPKTSRGTRCRILKKCPGQTGTSTKGALAAKGQDGAMADLKVAEWKVVEYQICLAGAAKSPKVARTRMAQHLIVVRNASGNVKLTNRRVGHPALGSTRPLAKPARLEVSKCTFWQDDSGNAALSDKIKHS